MAVESPNTLLFGAVASADCPNMLGCAGFVDDKLVPNGLDPDTVLYAPNILDVSPPLAPNEEVVPGNPNNPPLLGAVITGIFADKALTGCAAMLV